MTRRDRLEAKVERREEWAEKANGRADARFSTANTMAAAIPMGQPILVGHHSEGRDRRYRSRISSNMERGCEELTRAEHHRAKAAGLAVQLESSIFSDDTDAVAALQARIAEREAEGAAMKAINAAFRKAPGADRAAKLAALVERGVVTPAKALEIATFFGRCHWETAPYPAYATSNLRANIRRDQTRLEEIRARQVRAAAADATANGVAAEAIGDYLRITFAEKPAREVLAALREAGYRWGGGAWTGRADAVPQCVRALLPASSPEAAT